MKVKQLIEQLQQLNGELEVMTVHNHYSCGGDVFVNMAEPLNAIVVGNVGHSLAYGLSVVVEDVRHVSDIKLAVLLK